MVCDSCDYFRNLEFSRQTLTYKSQYHYDFLYEDREV